MATRKKRGSSTSSSAGKSSVKKSPTKKYSGKKRWSARVMRESDALDLEQGVFKKSNPRDVALSLKRSAEESKRRKAKDPYRSAMSMLVFYINRAGKNLPASRRRTLERAKDKLRSLCGRA